MVISRRTFFLILVTITLIDQLIKQLVFLNRGSLPIEVIPRLAGFAYASNTGIAFGLFAGNNALLGLISVLVIGLVITFEKHFRAPMEKLAAVLIIAGTSSNLLDRIARGSVLDYFYINHFSTFNLADVALTSGAALIITAYINEKFAKKKS